MNGTCTLEAVMFLAVLMLAYVLTGWLLLRG